MENILSFKGFNKDLKCRDFQYKIGRTYVQEGEIKCCEKGFHACKFPTDVFGYYPPIDDNRYCIVTQSGDIAESNNLADSKVASSKIFIKSEVSAEQLIEFGINYILSNINSVNEDIMYEFGNCFKTYEEAKEASRKIEEMLNQ